MSHVVVAELVADASSVAVGVGPQRCPIDPRRDGGPLVILETA
jgi:hypothetical protein